MQEIESLQHIRQTQAAHTLLKNCPTLEYLNLTSCRGLPRGMKRLYSDREKVENLRDDIIGGKFNNDDSDD